MVGWGENLWKIYVAQKELDFHFVCREIVFYKRPEKWIHWRRRKVGNCFQSSLIEGSACRWVREWRSTMSCDPHCVDQGRIARVRWTSLATQCPRCFSIDDCPRIACVGFMCKKREKVQWNSQRSKESRKESRKRRYWEPTNHVSHQLGIRKRECANRWHARNVGEEKQQA